MTSASHPALATAIEDVHGASKLPLLRRRLAAEAITGPFDAQLERIEHEAGVRQRL